MSRHNRIKKAADKQDVAGPYSEIGLAGLKQSGGLIYEEILRQLQGDRSWKTYREMADNDPIVGAMMYAIEMLLRKASWTTEPFDDSPQAQEYADFLKSCMDDMSHSWPDFIGEWMATPIYGYGPFEHVFKQRLGDNRDPGKRSKFSDGKIGVRKLAIRHPETRYRWEFDESGGVQAFVQQPPPDYNLRTIPIDKMLLFRVRARKGNPEGTSLIRNAYTSWYYKNKITTIEAIGIERDLAGMPVAYVPPQLLRADASAGDVALLEAIKQIVTRIRRDEQEGIVFPMVYDEDGHQLYKFELLSTGGRRQFDTSAIIQRYDQRIAMTILADVILIGHEKVGSYSLASSKSELFTAGVNSLLDDIAQVLNRHLVPRLMRINGFDTRLMPTFRPGNIEAVDLASLGDYVAKLSGAGMPLFPTEDGELERELLSVANLPHDSLRTPQPIVDTAA